MTTARARSATWLHWLHYCCITSTFWWRTLEKVHPSWAQAAFKTSTVGVCSPLTHRRLYDWKCPENEWSEPRRLARASATQWKMKSESKGQQSRRQHKNFTFEETKRRLLIFVLWPFGLHVVSSRSRWTGRCGGKSVRALRSDVPPHHRPFVRRSFKRRPAAPRMLFAHSTITRRRWRRQITQTKGRVEVEPEACRAARRRKLRLLSSPFVGRRTPPHHLVLPSDLEKRLFMDAHWSVPCNRALEGAEWHTDLLLPLSLWHALRSRCRVALFLCKICKSE